MKPNANVFHRLFAITAILAMVILSFTALSESYSATTMRLLHYEGEVEVEDSSGQPRFVMENARFNSGEALHTGTDSTATVGLDEGRYVTLDADTRVEFNKRGNAMELKLTEGTLFLDVQNKLSENETFDIQTSTMTIGIRGTIVYVSDLPADGGTGTDAIAENSAENNGSSGEDPSSGAGQQQGNPGDDGSGDGRIITLGVMEGIAEYTILKQDGTTETAQLSAGNKATVTDRNENGQADSDPVVTQIIPNDMSKFVMEQVTGDPNVLHRVEQASDALNPTYAADDDWEWSGTITLVAQSASKLFDGQPLTRPSDVLYYGFPAIFTLNVSAGGSQTAVGESSNPISSYAIYNSAGENVTSHFPHIETVAGCLRVDPAPLTVWTGSAEKYYDGEPLTNNEALLKFHPGYEKDEPTWRNTSYAVTESNDSHILYGISGSTWVHGTNPLTGESRELELHAGQRLSVYLSNESGAQSIEFRIENIPVTELPEEVLRLYADNPDLMAQACEDTDWDEEVLAGLIAQLSDEEGDRSTVEQNGLQVEQSEAGQVMQDCSNVRITIDTEITNYNGRPLNTEEAQFKGVTVDESIKVTVTGSQTEIGESPNTCEIDWGNASSGNYTLSYDLGTLTVLAPVEDAVTVTAASAEKVYDGEPLRDEGFSVTGLPSGYSIDVSVSGSRTEAGSSENRIESYRIFDTKGEDVTAAFLNVKAVNGTLTVEALQLSVDLNADEIEYDGTTVHINPIITYMNGNHAGETVSYGSPTGAKTVGQSYTLFTGDILEVSVTEPGKDAGTYTLDVNISLVSGANSNITLSNRSITYTVRPRTATVTTGSAEKVYDGTPLTDAEASISGLAEGDEVTVTATGSQTEIGKSSNTYTIDWGNAKAGNYTLTEELGTLEVTANAATVTFTAASEEKVYDGTPLSNGTVTAEGLPAGFTYTATAEGSRTDAGESENNITSYCILDAEGTDVTAAFTDIKTVPGTLKITPAELSISTGSASKVYDGMPLTNAETVIDGLIDGETITVTATGTVTDAGTASNTYAIDWGGMNPDNYTVAEELGMLTVSPAALTISTASAEKIYDGTPLTIAEAGITGMVDGETITVTATGTITDAGSAQNTYAIDWGTVNPDNYTVSDHLGTLEIEPLEMTIIIDGGEAVTYDGNSHGGEPFISYVWELYDCEQESSTSWRITLETGDVINVTITGGGTDVGTYPLSCEYSFSSDKASDYQISVDSGAVEIVPAPVTITTGSQNRMYDGTALTAPVTITGLVSIDKPKVTVTATGTITNVGSAENTYSIVWGTARSSNYTVTEEIGTLTVTENDTLITFSADGGEKEYDGTPLTNSGVTVSGLPTGFTSSASTSGSQTGVGSSDNTVASYAILDANSNNVTAFFSNIQLTNGTLTVKQNTTPITFTAGSDEKEYDGTPLTNSEVTASGLPDGFSFEASVSGSQTDANEEGGTNEVSSWNIIYNGENVSEYFSNVNTVSGRLIVKKRIVNLNLGGYTCTYDATPHTVRFSGTYNDGTVIDVTNTPQYENYGDMYAVGNTGVFSLTGGSTLTLYWGYKIDVGIYTIDPDKSLIGVAGNYDIHYSNNVLTIEKKTYGPTG